MGPHHFVTKAFERISQFFRISKTGSIFTKTSSFFAHWQCTFWLHVQNNLLEIKGLWCLFGATTQLQKRRKPLATLRQIITSKISFTFDLHLFARSSSWLILQHKHCIVSP